MTPRVAMTGALFGLLCGCASQGETLTAYAGTEATLPPDVVASAKQWMANRGIHNNATYNADGSVTFTYGSPEPRRMTRAEFKAFVESRLSNQTVSTGRRPDLTKSTGLTLTQIMYHGADGRFAAWTTTLNRVLRGAYSVKEQRNAFNQWAGGVGLMVCMDLDEDFAITQTGQRLGETCRPAYEYITAIYGKRTGDVFGLADGAAPSALDAANPPAWPDGQPLFPERAPHD